MAILSMLVETVARVEALDPAAVALIAREVRQAGLIKTGGRGNSAARMDFEDATNLLIAVNTARTIREAPLMVAKFRALQAWDNDLYEFLRPELRQKSKPPKLVGDLGQALEDLLKAVAGSTLPSRIPAFRRLLQDPLASRRVTLKLSFFQPNFRAALNIDSFEPNALSSSSLTVLDSASTSKAVSLWFQQPKPRKPNETIAGDRTESTSVGFATIQAIAQLLKTG